MKTFEYTHMALRQIRTNAMRSILTMLGIMIGIAAMISVISVGDGGRQRIDSELQRFGVNRLWIYPADDTVAKTFLTLEDCKTVLRGVPEAQAICPMAYKQTQISFNGIKMAVNIVGTTETFPKIESVTMKTGRFLSEADTTYSRNVIVLSQTVSEALFGSANPVQKKVTMQNQQFIVVGEESGATPEAYERGGEGRCYIPMAAYQKSFATNKIDEITLSTGKMEDTDAVGFKALTLLDKKHDGESTFKMFNLSKEIKFAQNIIDTFKMVVSGIAAISLLVGGIGIMNIMLVTVKERTREIGVRKALGATNTQILRQFLAEALMYSLIGGALGVAMGVTATFVFADMIHVPAVISPWTLVLCTGFSLAVGLFFGIFPAMKAAKLDPVQALRIE
jgi:putative ABC transport system permease protein